MCRCDGDLNQTTPEASVQRCWFVVGRGFKRIELVKISRWPLLLVDTVQLNIYERANGESSESDGHPSDRSASKTDSANPISGLQRYAEVQHYNTL